MTVVISLRAPGLVMSALKSCLASWCNKNLSKRALSANYGATLTTYFADKAAETVLVIVAFINIILRTCRTTFTTPEATGNVDDTELFMRHTLRLYLKMRERVAEEDDVEVGVNDREASNERVEDHLRANVHLADDSELYVHLADQLRALCPSCGRTPCSAFVIADELCALCSSCG